MARSQGRARCRDLRYEIAAISFATYLIHLVKFLCDSCCQPFISEPLSDCGVDEGIQPLKGVAGDVPLVQAEGELIDVPGKVFRAGVMIDAVETPLHYRPNALNAVRVCRSTGIFPGAVVHTLMAKEQTVHVGKDGVVISVQLRTRLNLPVNFILDGVERSVSDRLGDGSPATFPHPQNGDLPNRATASVEFLPFVLVGFLPADKALINFDDALQFVLAVWIGTRFSKPGEHEPSRLLRDADFLGKLHTTDALTGRDQEVHGVNPFVKRNMAPLENRPRADREVELTGVATVESARAPGDAIPGLALRALRTIRPETGFQVLTGAVFVREKLEQFEGADSGPTHETNCTLFPYGSQVYNSHY